MRKTQGDMFFQAQLPGIQQEFVGLGHELQNHRKQKQKLKFEHNVLLSRVSFFQKEAMRTARSIQQRKKEIQTALSIRRRREQQARQRQIIEYQNKQTLAKLKLETELERRAHYAKKERNQALLKRKNQKVYQQMKSQLSHGQTERRDAYRAQLQMKRVNRDEMEQQKKQARTKLELLKLQKNSEAIKQYRTRIKMQERQKQAIREQMKTLEMREKTLVDKLQHSYAQADKLESINPYEMDTDSLDKLMMPKKRSKSRAKSMQKGLLSARQRHSRQLVQEKLFMTERDSIAVENLQGQALNKQKSAYRT